MEENKKVVEETTEQPIEEVVEKIDESKFKSAGDDSVIKVDLNKPLTPPEKVVKEEQDEKVEELPVMEEVTIEELKDSTEKEVEEIKEVANEAIAETEATGKPLPENIQKLVSFMEETGGDLNDYVNLNRDVEKMDDSDVLDEYYKTTKSHLSSEERGFLLEDTFGIDEEVDDEKTIRKKKIALKEQVAEARAHLDRQKSKYYEERNSREKQKNIFK